MYKKNVTVQLYDGLTDDKILFDYNYQKQLLTLEAVKPFIEEKNKGQELNDIVKGVSSELDFYGKDFLIERPVLRAINGKGKKVILFDEIDKAPEEIEYMSKTSLKAFLNGKKMNNFYHVTIGYGAFNGINEMEVLEVLEEYGIIYSSEKYNSYGNYIVSYYIEKGIKNYLPEILNIKTNDKNNILYNTKYNENFKNISFIQQLVEDKTTLGVFQDILKFNYKDPDDTTKIYLETMSGLETDKEKKTILKYIVK